MKSILKTILILFSLLLNGCYMDDCDGPDGWGEFCSNVTYNCNGSECNQSDINIINKIIELSNDINDGMDCNSNGDIEPQEFGRQVWDNGRILELNISGDGNDKIEPQCKNVYVHHVDRLVLPDNIGDLDSLNILGIGTGTNFTNLPETIWNLNNLEDLSIGSNTLTSLSENIGNLSNLEKLDLNLDGLDSLPKSIYNLTKLKELHISSPVESLSDSILNLSDLNYLYLTNTNLTSLPETIVNLSSLKSLSVSNSQLISIPDSIGKLSNLSSLNLQHNKLTSIPESICSLPNTCYISVNYNKICDEKYRYDCIDNWGVQDCSE